MSTLIAVYKSDGTCIGRCDAHCYDAVHPHCDCICGGANHGAGEKKAIDNTRAYCEKWIDDFKERHGAQDGTGEITPTVQQFSLF